MARSKKRSQGELIMEKYRWVNAEHGTNPPAKLDLGCTEPIKTEKEHFIEKVEKQPKQQASKPFIIEGEKK